ncbi:MAG: hypothetical protein HC888_03470 [Candidatus Competibacteraceae bacterium]|nr:hypothetical protein [Candidatus Competibacteraceae bacterium]
MSTELQQYRQRMLPGLRTILRATRFFPQTKELDGGGTMMDGKPYPPVPVSAAWTIHSPEHGHIGGVLNTRWGYRAVNVCGTWAGCWHTSRDLCRDWYTKDWFWNRVVGGVQADAPQAAFGDMWLARQAYLDGATVEQAVALAKLGERFLKSFHDGYKTAAAWSSLHDPEGDGPEFIDGTGATWSKQADAETWRICRQFCQENAADLTKACYVRNRPSDHLGHDLWLTAAGHGVGFLDRTELEEGDLGERLTKACKAKPFRDREIYVHRKKIYYA